jgi:lysylphosphatidylglycerol synthetase-like protein (DUF2156 family)
MLLFLGANSRGTATREAASNMPHPHTTAPQVILKWPIGAAAAAVASIFFVLGLQLMHTGVNKNYSANAGENRGIRRRLNRSWWLGVVSHLFGALCILLALNYAALGLVMPMSCLTLIINTVFVPLINEHEHKIQIASEWSAVRGCFIAIIGACLMVASAEKYNTAFSVDHLEKLFQQYEFVVFQIICIFIILLLLFLARTQPRRHHGRRSFLLSFFSFSSGWTGAQQYLSLKALLEIWKASYLGKGPFLNPTSMSFFVCSTVLIFLQLVLINTGLKIFSNETVRFVGVYQACLLLIGSTSGGIYFQEFVRFGRWQWLFFVCGLFFMIWGIGVITLLRGRKKDIHVYTDIDDKNVFSCIYIYWICGPYRVLFRADPDFTPKVPSYEEDGLMTAEFDQVWGKDILW